MTYRSFFNFFPPPRFLEMPAPGLSLSDDAIRFVEFGHDSHTFNIKRMGTRKFPRQLIEAGNITDNQTLVKELNTFRKEHDLKHIRASLPEEKAYLFSTVLTAEQSENLRTSIEFVIEENVPISVSEAVFDYTIALQNENDPKGSTRVSVSVLPEGDVKKFLGVFREAGFDPLHFEIESQAITKAIISPYDHGIYIILNVSSSKVGIYVVSGGAVTFTSTVQIMPFASDEKEKDKRSGDERRRSQETFSSIEKEIEKVLSYLQTQADNNNEKPKIIGKVVLVGEEATREGLEEHLFQTLKIPTQKGNVWENAFSLNDYVPPISKNDSLQYAAAVGLALPQKPKK